MVSAKYVLIVLAADDRGGGGIFALYSLLCRYVRVIISSSSLDVLLSSGLG